MCEPKEGFWGDITIKKTLFWIIWTAGICGWIYFGVSFTAIQAEANETWTHVQQLQNKDVGTAVEESPSTEVRAQSDKEEQGGEVSMTDSAPSGVEKLIYEIAQKRQFPQPEVLVRIAKAESGLHTCTKNPSSSAIGLFQILDMHGLTKEERCNPEIAINWAIDHFAGGHPWDASRSKWDKNYVE